MIAAVEVLLHFAVLWLAAGKIEKVIKSIYLLIRLYERGWVRVPKVFLEKVQDFLLTSSIISFSIIRLLWMLFTLIAPEPEPEIRTIYVQVKEDYIGSWLKFVDFQTVVMVLVGAVLASALTYGLGLVLFRFVTSAMLRYRGIEQSTSYESMIAGSEFRKAVLPACQVPIFCLGTFSDSFVGFGLRVGSFLVVPTHVMESVKGSRIVLKSANLKKGVLMNSAPIPSKVCSDLSYYPMANEVWTTLAIRDAPIAKFTEGVISVAGFKDGEVQASSGQLCKSQFVGILKYSGSTVRGFSGAAYVRAGLVVGIHTGAAIDHNAGISSVVFAEEIKSFVHVEAKKGLKINEQDYLPAEQKARNLIRQEHTVWSEAEVQSMIAGAKQGNWADMSELDQAGISWESEEPKRVLSAETVTHLKQLPVNVIQELQKVCGTTLDPQLVVRGQNPQGSTVVITGDVCEERYKRMQSRIQSLEDRLAAFSEKMAHFLENGSRPSKASGQESPQKKVSKEKTQKGQPKAEPKKLVKAEAKPVMQEKPKVKPAEAAKPKKELSESKVAYQQRRQRRRYVRLAEKHAQGQIIAPSMYARLRGQGLLKPKDSWPTWAQNIASELKAAQSGST